MKGVDPEPGPRHELVKVAGILRAISVPPSWHILVFSPSLSSWDVCPAGAQMFSRVMRATGGICHWHVGVVQRRPPHLGVRAGSGRDAWQAGGRGDRSSGLEWRGLSFARRRRKPGCARCEVQGTGAELREPRPSSQCLRSLLRTAESLDLRLRPCPLRILPQPQLGICSCSRVEN